MKTFDQFDESLFADKIKEYRPSIDMKPIHEEDLINDDAEQFDLTQVDIGGNEEENKKAMIGE